MSLIKRLLVESWQMILRQIGKMKIQVLMKFFIVPHSIHASYSILALTITQTLKCCKNLAISPVNDLLI